MTLHDRSFKFRRCLTPIALGLALSAATMASGEDRHDNNSNPAVYPPGSKPYGLTYGDWSARWWQWVLSIPPENNPILDGIQGKPFHGNNCAEGQSHPVWFLPGTFGGSAFRTCRVPTGISLLFPILNSEFGAGVGDCQTQGGTGDPRPCASYMYNGLTGVPALQAAAADAVNNPVGLQASFDGVPIANPASYRAASQVFSYWLTSDSLFNALFGFRNAAGLYSPLVSDGYWVMLTPLREGTHTLHFKAGTFLDVTYILIVERE